MSGKMHSDKGKVWRYIKSDPLKYTYCFLFSTFIFRILWLFAVNDAWAYYPDHNDFDITDFGISMLALHFDTHWYPGYGYLAFLFSTLSTLMGYMWHILFSNWMSLHDFLVYSIMEPKEILIFNRVGFFIALCVSVFFAGYYVKRKTNIYYGLIFISGITLTTSFQSLKYYIKSQAIDVIWIVLSMIIAERLHDSLNRKNLVLAGCVLGFAWSTTFTGLFLAITFFITIAIYQINSYLKKTSTLKEGLTNLAVMAGAFLLAFFLTSPYALIKFGEWSENSVVSIIKGDVSAFTWDAKPSLQKTLTYIGYNSIFPASVLITLFFGFVLNEIRARSTRYIYPIFFVILSLIVYPRSPHVRDYYLFSFVTVMTITSLIFIYKIEEVLPKLEKIIPVLLITLVIVTNYNSQIFSSFFDFSFSREQFLAKNWGSVNLTDYEKDGRILAKQWIVENIEGDSTLILDGWPHFLPPITCSDPLSTSKLWGHYRYGRQFNGTIQELVRDAWIKSIKSGDKTYDCVFSDFTSVSLEEEKLKRLQYVIAGKENKATYYLLSTEWYNQFLNKGMNLQQDQIPFVEYYGNLIKGKFGPIVYRNKQVVIVEIDKEKYLSI